MQTSPQHPTSPQVPQHWAWHYQRLQSFRDHLLDTHAIQIAEVSGPLEQNSMDTADTATDEFEHDLALGLLSQERDALYEVEAAIRRILDGSYGICEETGKPIPAARLRLSATVRCTSSPTSAWLEAIE